MNCQVEAVRAPTFSLPQFLKTLCIVSAKAEQAREGFRSTNMSAAYEAYVSDQSALILPLRNVALLEGSGPGPSGDLSSPGGS